MRQSHGRPISTTGFSKLVRWHPCIESGPWLPGLQWWLDTRRFNLCVANLQIHCNLHTWTPWKGTRILVPEMATRWCATFRYFQFSYQIFTGRRLVQAFPAIEAAVNWVMSRNWIKSITAEWAINMINTRDGKPWLPREEMEIWLIDPCNTWF